MKKLLSILLIICGCSTAKPIAVISNGYLNDKYGGVYYFDTSIYKLRLSNSDLFYPVSINTDTIIHIGNVHNGICCWLASDTFYVPNYSKK